MTTSLIDIEKVSSPEQVEHASSIGYSPGKPIDKVIHVEGNIQLLDGQGKVRLVPTPTTSAKDPLNFSRMRKLGILFTVCWFSTMSLSIVGGFGALLPYFFGVYIPEGVSPDEIVWLATWPSLFTGVGNFLFLPLAIIIGRRPIFILAAVMLAFASVGAALTKTFTAHLTARIFQGFAAGATESLLPLIITDMTFAHERAWYFGFYWVMQSVVTAILNVASSYEAINLHWTWYYWIFAILNFIGLFFVIFLSPETRFSRPPSAIDGQVTKVDDFGNLVVLSDEEAKEILAKGETQEHYVDDEDLSYAQRLMPWSGVAPNSGKMLVQVFYRMALALLDPAIVWALAASSIILAISIAQSLSFGGILQSAPYNWPPQNTGLNYLGALPAGAAAMITCGWGGDKINMWLARRNGGQHLPEHRLPCLIFPIVTGIGMSLMYGFCAANPSKVSWFSIVFSNNYWTYVFICALIVTTTYAVEAATHHAGAALVMVVGGKNLVSFGASYGIVTLVNTGEYARAYGILTGIMAGIMALGIPLYFLMPGFRLAKARRS